MKIIARLFHERTFMSKPTRTPAPHMNDCLTFTDVQHCTSDGVPLCYTWRIILLSDL